MNDAENPELKPLIRAGLARAYVELEECKRKLKMKPLPKSIDVTKLAKSKQAKRQSTIVRESPKESLSPEETVTTPPAQEGE